jgi:hypothetical protein
MIWGATKKRGIGAATHKRTQHKPAFVVAAATLVLGSMLDSKPVLAAADCSSAPSAAPTAPATSSFIVGSRSSLHSPSSQPPCHRSGGALVSMASALSPRTYVARPLIDNYSVNPRDVNSSRAQSAAASSASWEGESGLEARFGVRWQTMTGPAWVQRVPSWLIQDARTYHRRGLPVLHLWESSNYLVALGLSNHGVPGVYFSQKLP